MTRRLIFEVEEYRCPVCGSDKDVVVDYEGGQVICKNCGTVLKEGVADLGPEWRKPEASRAYAGPIGSSIGEIERGNVKITDKLRAIMLGKFSKPMSTPLERLELDAREFFESARVRIGLPKVVVDEAVALYREVYKAGFRASKIEGYAAVLYFVAKRHGLASVTLKALTEKLGIDRSILISAYMELTKVALNLGIRPPKADPKIYIPRIAASLGIGDEKSAEVQRVAVDILRYITSSPRIRNGRKPQVLAAAAVYYACFIAGVEITQKELARAADSTEGPIRELLRELADKLYIELTV